MPMKTTITYACINAMGSLRKNNEDNFFVQGRFRRQEETEDLAFSGSFTSKERETLAILDGMGGEACGETASLLAASGIAGFPFTEKNPEKEIKELIEKLNHSVCAYAEANGINGMGSTAVGVHFGKRHCQVFHCGDSRAYLIRKGQLNRLTTDQSAPAMGERKGPLLQYLGLKEYRLDPGYSEIEYRDGDKILLCSDGLTDMVPDQDIQAILETEKNPEQQAADLYIRAMQNGGRDNVTIILCQIKKTLF